MSERAIERLLMRSWWSREPDLRQSLASGAYSDDFTFTFNSKKLDGWRLLRLSKDLRERVVHWRLEDGKTYRELVKLAGCSIGTISIGNTFFPITKSVG
jgi:hypothetical protein